MFMALQIKPKNLAASKFFKYNFFH